MKQILTLIFVVSSLSVWADDSEVFSSFVICPIEADCFQAKSSVQPTAGLEEDSPLIDVIFLCYNKLNEESSIENVEIPSSKSVYCIYDLNGTKHDSLINGINIVLYEDGTFGKVLRK